MQRISPVMENSHGSRRCFRPLGSGFSVVLGSIVLPVRKWRVGSETVQDELVAMALTLQDHEDDKIEELDGGVNNAENEKEQGKQL